MRPSFVWVVFLLAFLLRFIGIGQYPSGLNPDEASLGYDAYSLFKTGKDQWGISWPLSLHSFGDYKLPLYSYLAIPSVAIFGLNEFSTRLPNAFFGFLGVVCTYLLVLELFKNKTFAGASAFILAISPWHVMLSRGAFEANLSTFFIPLGIWAFLKGILNPKWMLISAIAFGLNLFSYHSARLVTPILVVGLIYMYRSKILVKKNILALLIFSFFACGAGISMINGGLARGQDVGIFNPTDKGESIFQRRNEGYILGLPDQISRAFSNKYSFVLDEFIKNYATYFSPQFLFTQGPNERTYGMIPGVGVFYLVEVFFFALAIYFLIKKQKLRKFAFIFLWLALAPIPAALAKGGGFAANRAALMMPAIQIISAYGFFMFYKTTKSSLVRISTAVILGISFLLFLENYLFHAPNASASSMMHGRREMVETLKNMESQYDRIIVSRALSEPHIYFAFYRSWDPTNYQHQTKDWWRYKQEGRTFLDQLGKYSLGKYLFTDINYQANSQVSGILLVGKVEEFPAEVSPLEIIYYPNGKPAILFVDPSKISYAKASHAKTN